MPARQTLPPTVPAMRPPAMAMDGQSAAAARRHGTLGEFLRIAPVIVLVLGMLMPVEVRVNFAGQTIYAYRLAWMLFAPWMLFEIFRGRFAFRAIDALVVMCAFWTVLSFTVVDGFARGLPAGIALGFDILMPYLITRHVIRTANDLRYLLIVLAPLALLIAGLMVLEAISHQRFLRSAAQAVFGSLGSTEFGDVSRRIGGIDIRYGMARAMGPFSHPILAGLFFAGLLPLYWFSKIRGWPLYFGLASGIGVFFALSSAPLFGVAIFVVLAIYDKLRRMFVFLNWPMFIVSACAVVAALHVLSSRGIIGVLIQYTMNPATGYYRLLIWEYGAKSVKRNLLFGTGYAPFEGAKWMGDSVDSLWLAIAIRNGLPTAVFLGAAALMAIIGLALAASRLDRQNQSILIGLAITLTIFFIMGFTVSLFGGVLIWFAMLLGVGVTLGQHIASRPKAVRVMRVRRLA